MHAFECSEKNEELVKGSLSIHASSEALLQLSETQGFLYVKCRLQFDLQNVFYKK